jgi:outer membrane receptor for ferrienterochelin and colicins
VWRLGAGFTAKGGASHGFKAPNLKQTVPGARAEGPNTVIGNPALAPEVADAVELGLAWERGPRQWQLTAFDQRVRDLIELRLVSAGAAPGTGTYVYENLAEARLRGVELMAVEPLARGLTAQLAVTGLEARDGNGRRLERRPRLSATLRLDAQWGRWRAGWAVEHSGEQWLPSSTVGAAALPVPTVTLQSAQAAVDLGRGLELQAGVRNLHDVRLADRSPLFTQVEAPRTWRLALRGRW